MEENVGAISGKPVEPIICNPMTKTDQGVEKSANRYKAVPRTLSFITHGDEVLLLRGAPTKRIWPNQYNGVGGHVEADEDIYTSAVREMREETGLDVADARLRGILNIDVGQETGIIVFVFTARALGRDVRPSPEGTLEWIKQDQHAKRLTWSKICRNCCPGCWRCGPTMRRSLHVITMTNTTGSSSPLPSHERDGKDKLPHLYLYTYLLDCCVLAFLTRM